MVTWMRYALAFGSRYRLVGGEEVREGGDDEIVWSDGTVSRDTGNGSIVVVGDMDRGADLGDGYYADPEDWDLPFLGRTEWDGSRWVLVTWCPVCEDVESFVCEEQHHNCEIDTWSPLPPTDEVA